MNTGQLTTFAQVELVMMVAIFGGLMLVPQLKQQNWGKIGSVALVAVIIINLLNGGQGIFSFIRWALGLVGINL